MVLAEVQPQHGRGGGGRRAAAGRLLLADLGQINELLHRDNVINMDSRTVPSCLPTDDTSGDALLTDTELLVDHR